MSVRGQAGGNEMREACKAFFLFKCSSSRSQHRREQELQERELQMEIARRAELYRPPQHGRKKFAW